MANLGSVRVPQLLTTAFFVCWTLVVLGDENGPLFVPNSAAEFQEEMKSYAELIEHTDVKIRMIPIRGGEFMMGSPSSEATRSEDEGPQHVVSVDPFWMAETETTWDAFDIWVDDVDVRNRKKANQFPNARDKAADEYQLSQPSQPYVDMDLAMGKPGFPAINMTQLAAKTFCDWLSQKTGRYYRLPTEAEWEYACRAGTDSAYSWGENPQDIGEYAWYFGNTSEAYRKVRMKKPNPWGLYDMHGNVSEWVLDQYDPHFYGSLGRKPAANPLLIPRTIYPRVVRGGSYYDGPDRLRSAARDKSDPSWKVSEPMLPKTIWWHIDAPYFGFRIIRPLERPSAAAIREKWGKSKPVQTRKRIAKPPTSSAAHQHRQ